VLAPAVLALGAARFLVPSVGTGFAGFVADAQREFPLYFWLALFLVFSGMAHYWRSQLPGGRYAWRQASEGARDPAARRREALALAILVASAVAIALGFRAWVARPYRVLSSSMQPTLEPGDLIVARAQSYADGRLPRRGDLVVFRSAAVPGWAGAATAPEVLVKRVIGLPGDTIAMRGPTPVINGWPVPSCDVGEYVVLGREPGDPGVQGRLAIEFLEDRAYVTVRTFGALFPDGYRVKPGEVFVLGDSRGNSTDSRAYNAGHGGGVPADAVDGRAQWFLAGTHRSGHVDLGRLLAPIDSLEVRVRYEGIRTEPIQDAIERCLRGRPSQTQPPPPGGP
jgi:signal peptidase I